MVRPAQMIIASMQVPTLDEIAKKEQSIKEAQNHKFNDKDIEDVSSCSTWVFYTATSQYNFHNFFFFTICTMFCDFNYGYQLFFFFILKLVIIDI